MQKLTRTFYNRDTVTVAKDLLGKYLIHKIDDKKYIGKIVEVEAYLGMHDLASHSSKGLTKRTEIMFGPPGFAYVYLIYGIYYCFNIVTEPAGQGAAVLIRAVEPIKNIDTRTQGPGLLCKAMQIDKRHNALDLTNSNLYIANTSDQIPFSICAKPRIGVAYAGEWAKELLRFYIQDNPYVSKL